VTGNPAIADDMRNAGAEWEDAEVVVDGHLVSSRKPDDLPAFLPALIEVVAHAPAPASRRPTSFLPARAGWAPIRMSVWSTASRTVSGSASKSLRARCIRRGSGKPQLASHLVQGAHPARSDIRPALAQRLESVVVAEDFQRLGQRVVLLAREHHFSGGPLRVMTTCSCRSFHVVEQVGEPGTGLREWDHSGHASDRTGLCTRLGNLLVARFDEVLDPALAMLDGSVPAPP
jgi:hypothetical protein